MAWITNSEDDREILEEIMKQTDRAAALISSAYLEERLLLAIKARLKSDKEAENEIFRTSGPMGAFSVRIKMAYLLGIYSSQVFKILDAVKEIRNEFAHNAKPRDFNSQRIKSLCENISISCTINLNNKKTGEAYVISLQPDGTSRTAYMNAIQLLLLILDLEIKQLPLRKPAEPVFDIVLK